MATTTETRAHARGTDALALCHDRRTGTPRFIPEGQFYAIPQAELIVNDPQVILDNVFGCTDSHRHFAIFQAFGNKFDDSLFAFAWDTASIAPICRHDCLR